MMGHHRDGPFLRCVDRGLFKAELVCPDRAPLGLALLDHLAEQPSPNERRTPHTRPEQRTPKRTPGLIREYLARPARWIRLYVVAQSVDGERRQRHVTPAGLGLWVRLR